MSDDNNNDDSSFGSGVLGHQVRPIDINEEMQSSYIDYATSVIVGRALPKIRDGLKPVHRRILYATFDNGYRPERGYVKFAEPVSGTAGNYHPHSDGTIYNTVVRIAQPQSMCYPFVDGQGNFGSRNDDGPAAMRYTEARLTPLVMRMVYGIREDTVDFQPNYDDRTTESVILPSHVPQLLMSGSGGITVGMATNIPPHNLREVADAINWCLDDPDTDEKTALDTVMERIKGPDFPVAAQIVGDKGIKETYTTGRGSIRIRGVTSIEQEGTRQSIVTTELPYQVDPDRMIANIADRVKDGRLQGITSIDNESDLKWGMRIVVKLKRDAVPRVVLNNLYKHSQLQTSFGANMLAIVDDMPRTLRIDQMVTLYAVRQIEVIVRRTQYRLDEKEKHAHILHGLVKALDMLDEVIAPICRSATVDTAHMGPIGLLDIDEIQADAILVMQLRHLAALECQKVIGELAEIELETADLKDILTNPDRQRAVVKEKLGEVMEKYGGSRRTQVMAAKGDATEEDLIAHENVVVTVTSTGYAKRTKVDAYKAQRRDGKGVHGADLKQDDIVRHFFACSTHDWILFFTNKGRVYRLKAYELPKATRAARGQHVANLLEFQLKERIAEVLQIQSYQDSPYLVLVTNEGKVRKSRLEDYESARSADLITINLREGDSLIGARLCSADDDLLLVSERGQAIRFTASDDALHPMGHATAGVQGMRFRGDDKLLSTVMVEGEHNLLVATTGGFDKKTKLSEYTPQNRGGIDVLTLKYDPKRGPLMGALVVDNDGEIFAITSADDIIRTNVNEIRATSHTIKGMRLVNLADSVELLAIDRNVEDEGEETASKISEAGTLDTAPKRTGAAKSTGAAESGDSEAEKE